MKAPALVSEEERLAALHECGILDSEPEPSFDDVARLASQLCRTPIALVSLVDRERQWFKARIGWPTTQGGRRESFCTHAIESNAPMIVPDALLDERFANNPLVLGPENIRFYAGIPLVLDDGAAVGSLCVIDNEPREIDPAQLAALHMLAKQVTTELSLRRRLANTKHLAWHESSPHDTRTPPLDVTRVTTRRPVAMPSLTSTWIAGRYEVLRTLGAGGMGVVVEALDTQEKRHVAVKFLLRHALSDDRMLERFAREARALMQLSGSEHVTRALDAGNLANGSPYIVMELLRGKSLQTLLEERGPMPVPLAAKLMIQACEGVAHAHEAGILHRDLKPSNLMLLDGTEGSEQLKVLDFGVAKEFGEDAGEAPQITMARELVGTPHYMSPEQLLGEALDERSDVWSLGVIFYELVVGARPFDAPTFIALTVKIYSQPAEPPSARAAGLPPKLDAIIAKCFERDRTLRYAGVRELAADLHELL